jgi:hypothetical protein
MVYGLFSRKVLLGRSPSPPAFSSALILIGEDLILDIIEVAENETVII